MILECKAEGAVCYDWYKNSQPYKEGLRDGVLILESCTVKDSGEYYCVVSNDGGRAQSKTAKMTVGELDKIIIRYCHSQMTMSLSVEKKVFCYAT